MALYAGTQFQSFFFPSRNLSTSSNDFNKGDPDLFILNPGAGSPEYKTRIFSIYFFLQIFGGHFGLPVILLTLLLKRDVRRHPLLINFLVTWVLYATAFCLLLYVGQQFGPEPPVGLCLSQASLIYGAPLMCSSAGLAFVINIWLGINALSGKRASFNIQKWRDYLLISVPYILFVIVAITMAVIGAAYPQFVTRRQYFFYCTINLNIVNLIPGCSVLFLLCILLFEVLIGVRLYRMNKAFMKMKADSSPPLNLIVRVVIFSIYSVLSLLACIGFWSQQGDDAPYIIQASLPTASFVIFGSQPDFLQAWGITNFWLWLHRHQRKQINPASMCITVGRKCRDGMEVLLDELQKDTQVIHSYVNRRSVSSGDMDRDQAENVNDPFAGLVDGAIAKERQK